MHNRDKSLLSPVDVQIKLIFYDKINKVLSDPFKNK